MELRVLGTCGGHPWDGDACSGYLVRTGTECLLLDCGPGVATRLAEIAAPGDLDAVLLTHMHTDHYLDLFPLAYRIMAECTGGAGAHFRRLRVLLPAGGMARFAAVSAAIGHAEWSFPADLARGPAYQRFREMVGHSADWVFAVFDVQEYTPGEALEIGETTVHTFPVHHNVPAAAFRLVHDGRAFVYSGDSGACGELVTAAKGADLFLVDSFAIDQAPPGSVHLSPYDAGCVAAAAGAARVLLTHLHPSAHYGSVLAAAGEGFGGAVELAQSVRVVTW
ncbi:MAG: MBL fold metallo-hydrolase [Frankia sp.]